MTMKKHFFWLYCIALFGLYFVTAYNLPINKYDDFIYSSHSITGGTIDTSKLLSSGGVWAHIYNAAELQRQEYYTAHGRLATHIIYRLAIGLPYFLPYFFNALGLFGIFFVSAWAMFPYFLKNKNLLPLGLIVFMCSFLFQLPLRFFNCIQFGRGFGSSFILFHFLFSRFYKKHSPA